MDEMFEQTSQTDEIELLDTEDILDQPDGDEDQQEKDAAEVEVQEETTPETVNARYNGRDIPLDREAVERTAQALGVTQEEYISMLQKGMNYDRALERAQNAKEFQLLDYYANMNGMSRQEYVDWLEGQKNELQLQRERESLAQRHPDAPPELLREMAQTRVEQQRNGLMQREYQERIREEQARRQPWREFFEQFPECPDADSVPPEVYDMVNGGEHPVQAYLRYKNRQLELELAAQQQNEANRRRTIGTARGDGDGTGADPFLEGLFDI